MEEPEPSHWRLAMPPKTLEEWWDWLFVCLFVIATIHIFFK